MRHSHPKQSVFSYYANFSLYRSSRLAALIAHFSQYNKHHIYQHIRRHSHMRATFTTLGMMAAVIPLSWWLNGSLGYQEVNTINHIQQPVLSLHSIATSPTVLTVLIQKGDDLASIFKRHQFNPNILPQLSEIKQLQKLYPNHILSIRQEHGNVQELSLNIDLTKKLRIFKTNNGFSSEVLAQDVNTDTVVVHGKVGNSLFASANAMGLSEQLVLKMLEIFRWDMDFHPLDVTDTFTVVYQRHYQAGKTQAGDILAAEIVNREKVYQAVRYVDPQGMVDYYKPNGTPLFNVIAETEGSHFPIAPLQHLDISSNFGMRTHPVYHKKRFHSGIDYAARYGTPIAAVADATVKYVGWQNGYGNTVILQHDEHRDTVYAHISRFADIKLAQEVKQGEIIGYVGKTGVTTGAHLHYEFRYDDEPRHPKELTFPPPDQPLQTASNIDMADFTQHTQTVVAQLQNASQGLAANFAPATTSLAKAAGTVDLATRD